MVGNLHNINHELRSMKANPQKGHGVKAGRNQKSGEVKEILLQTIKLSKMMFFFVSKNFDASKTE